MKKTIFEKADMISRKQLKTITGGGTSMGEALCRGTCSTDGECQAIGGLCCVCWVERRRCMLIPC